MNWVGGARSRIRRSEHLRRQKEYFERHKLQSKVQQFQLASAENAKASQDLVSFQISCKLSSYALTGSKSSEEVDLKERIIQQPKKDWISQKPRAVSSRSKFPKAATLTLGLPPSSSKLAAECTALPTPPWEPVTVPQSSSFLQAASLRVPIPIVSQQAEASSFDVLLPSNLNVTFDHGMPSRLFTSMPKEDIDMNEEDYSRSKLSFLYPKSPSSLNCHEEGMRQFNYPEISSIEPMEPEMIHSTPKQSQTYVEGRKQFDYPEIASIEPMEPETTNLTPEQSKQCAESYSEVMTLEESEELESVEEYHVQEEEHVIVMEYEVDTEQDTGDPDKDAEAVSPPKKVCIQEQRQAYIMENVLVELCYVNRSSRLSSSRKNDISN